MVICCLIPSTGPEKGTFLGFKGKGFFVTAEQNTGFDSHTLLCQSRLKVCACVNSLTKPCNSPVPFHH